MFGLATLLPKCLTQKTVACSSSSRNYDLTIQFCNTSLRPRGQRSVALNHYLVARRASRNHCCTQQSALTQKLWQNTKYLEDDGINNRLQAVMIKFVQCFNICSSQSERGTVPFVSPGHAPGNSVLWLCRFVLILLLQVQIRRQLTPATKTQI